MEAICSGLGISLVIGLAFSALGFNHVSLVFMLPPVIALIVMLFGILQFWPFFLFGPGAGVAYWILELSFWVGINGGSSAKHILGFTLLGLILLPVVAFVGLYIKETLDEKEAAREYAIRQEQKRRVLKVRDQKLAYITNLRRAHRALRGPEYADKRAELMAEIKVMKASVPDLKEIDDARTFLPAWMQELQTTDVVVTC